MSYSGKLCDLQVNGYLNISFAEMSLNEADCIHAFRRYLAGGSAFFMPTVITASEEIYQHVFGILSKVSERGEFRHKIPGFHLEGPFLSDQSGAIGAHNPAWTRRPDMELFKRLQDWAGGKIKLVTIAAELEGAAALCRALTDQGISVSLGHQLADYDDLSRLADAGARAITHLGNGMPSQVDRHNNPLVNGLIHPDLIPMIITDGHHLPASLVAGIIRLRGADQVIFVSDAAPLAGLPPGEYETLGNQCVLAANGRLYNPTTQYLVGSSYTMQACADFLSDTLFIDNQDIEKMGYLNALDLIA